MNSTILIVLLLSLSLSNANDCFWDSECPAIGCCVNSLCMDVDSCNAVRSYPKENFQICYENTDCNSGCCHNNFCTMLDTCNSGDSAIVIIFFLIILGLTLLALLFFLIKDVIRFRNNKA